MPFESVKSEKMKNPRLLGGFFVPGTGTLHNSHISTACLKWRYQDESAQFELNWALFSFGFEEEPLFT
jgi:hypothetical protein